MGYAEVMARQQAAVYAKLGIDADWGSPSTPVRVILRDDDAIVGRAVADSVIIRVRKSEVPAPVAGDPVALEDGRTYAVFGEPLLDRKGSWRCEAQPTS